MIQCLKFWKGVELESILDRNWRTKIAESSYWEEFNLE